MLSGTLLDMRNRSGGIDLREPFQPVIIDLVKDTL